jgi:hypothetical protein
LKKFTSRFIAKNENDIDEAAALRIITMMKKADVNSDTKNAAKMLFNLEKYMDLYDFRRTTKVSFKNKKRINKTDNIDQDDSSRVTFD